MGDTTTELVLGAQTKAAGTAAAAVSGLQTTLKNAAEGMSGETAGFTGSGAGAFYEALKAWYAAGAKIPSGVNGYAGKLATTDQETASSQGTSVQAYSRARDRLSPVPR
ncbi:hypothetical protein [Lapillicoccus sp.]|uniref:hypothetical protein n=1 Tax=Lapillicoccus sp. TaxID=1909287 RepID=UPI0032657BCD